MKGIWVLFGVFCGACGAPDTPTVDGGSDMPGHGLACDPRAVSLAASASSAADPLMVNLGDPDPATPAETGDGKYHLFVGVAHESSPVGSSCGGEQGFVVLLHDATSSRADGEFRVPAQPLFAYQPLAAPYDFDRFGMETPSYLRADEHREYLYYCAIYTSYDCRQTIGVRGKLAALRRVDGGPWERVQADVAPFGPGSNSQCEPEVIRDPTSGLFHLYFVANGDRLGLLVRSSSDPESFPVSSEQLFVDPSEQWGAQLGVSLDPWDGVWRFVGGVKGSGLNRPPPFTQQTWAGTPLPTFDTLRGNARLMHEATHTTDLHPDVHTNGGIVSQTGGAMYLDGGDVLFFFAGIGTANRLQVFSQRCMRTL